jgi:Spy/CpxP family protein refolding chaperone
MYLSRMSIAVVVATVFLFCSQALLAQGQGRRGPLGEGFRLRVLALSQVQDDLNLTEDQKAAANKAGESLQGLFGGLQNATQEERQQKMQEIQAKTRAAIDDVNKVLSKEQNERLDQIVLQARGAGALADEKLAADLKITDAQRQKLQEIQQQTRQQMRDAQGDREKMAQIRKTSQEQALAALTEEQRQQFDKMQGAKIDLPANLGFGGRRQQ